jgi:hypothetical protein
MQLLVYNKIKEGARGHYATTRKVADSILDEVIFKFT